LINRVAFFRGLRDALLRIDHPPLFESERGYQGALVAELSASLPALGLPNADVLVEQEYQKRFADHGLNIRPDIVIHVPFRPDRHVFRSQDNFVVFELKLHARADEARAACANLRAMILTLNYDLAVFLNIDSLDPHGDMIPADVADRLIALAVTLRAGETVVTGN
jgi:hypothetical protein